jgi:hypothetical protein
MTSYWISGDLPCRNIPVKKGEGVEVRGLILIKFNIRIKINILFQQMMFKLIPVCLLVVTLVLSGIPNTAGKYIFNTL